MLELKLSLDLFRNHRRLRFLDIRLLGHDPFDLLIGSHGRSKIIAEPSNHLHRPDNIVGVLRKCAQFSDGDPFLNNHDAADYDDRHQHHLGKKGDVRLILYDQLRLLHI